MCMLFVVIRSGIILQDRIIGDGDRSALEEVSGKEHGV